MKYVPDQDGKNPDLLAPKAGAAVGILTRSFQGGGQVSRVFVNIVKLPYEKLWCQQVNKTIFCITNKMIFMIELVLCFHNFATFRYVFVTGSTNKNIWAWHFIISCEGCLKVLCSNWRVYNWTGTFLHPQMWIGEHSKF